VANLIHGTGFYYQLVYTFSIAVDYPFYFGNHPQILHKGLFPRPQQKEEHWQKLGLKKKSTM
jgi:hypothetical protein